LLKLNSCTCLLTRQGFEDFVGKLMTGVTPNICRGEAFGQQSIGKYEIFIPECFALVCG